MKGVILAGGTGSRLLPLTQVTNKHLLPIYNKPMIFYPLQTLINMGVKDILVVSGIEHCGHILQLLGSGKDFDVNISYKVQDMAGGIAQALGLAESFVNNDNVSVILGDNIYEDTFDVTSFSSGAHFYLKEVKDAHRFGVADVVNNYITCIEEKPKNPRSNLAVTGLYIYDNKVFDIIEGINPSERGEMEITDVNNKYIQLGKVSYDVVKGDWTDAGTFESLHRANIIARSISLR